MISQSHHPNFCFDVDGGGGGADGMMNPAQKSILVSLLWGFIGILLIATVSKSFFCVYYTLFFRKIGFVCRRAYVRRLYE